MVEELRPAKLTAVIGASLVVALSLLHPAGAGAASLSFDYGPQTVPSTVSWGCNLSGPTPQGLCHSAGESFQDHIYFNTGGSFKAQFFNPLYQWSIPANFQSLTVDLYTGAGALAWPSDANSPAPLRTASASASSVLSAGQYDIRISGQMANSLSVWNSTLGAMAPVTSLGAAGYLQLTAASSPVLLTSVSPVPEPETYAMMLAGLGLMGFVMRRRKPA